MSDTTNVIDAMVAVRSTVERRLLGNEDYVLLCKLDEAIRAAHSAGASSIRLAPLAIRHLSQTDAAYAVLGEIGHPTPTSELLSAVTRNGVCVGGANPSTNFSSALSRDSRFQSIHWSNSRRWWVTDRAIPPDPRAELSREPAMA